MCIVKSMTGLLGNSSGWLLASVHAAEGKVNKKWDQRAKNRTCKHGLHFCLVLVLLLVLNRFLWEARCRRLPLSQAHSFCMPAIPDHIYFLPSKLIWKGENIYQLELHNWIAFVKCWLDVLLRKWSRDWCSTLVYSLHSHLSWWDD